MKAISTTTFLRMSFKMEKERFEERRKDDDRRGSVVDRRLGLDRRRGPGRRLADDRKAAEEGQMSDEQFDFLMAIGSPRCHKGIRLSQSGRAAIARTKRERASVQRNESAFGNLAGLKLAQAVQHS